jgi:glucose-1-phosphate cytidylyltransferase
MTEIGGKPILWHIMKIYSHYGFNDFIVCLGYKGFYIKEYFANYFLHQSDVTFDFSDDNKMIFHNKYAEPWKVTLIDTGLETMTGGRLDRIKSYLNDETFMMTYGDGVSDVDLNKLLEFHKKHKKLATVTSVQPVGRFGSLNLDRDGNVLGFIEKPKGDGLWINGGFFVLQPEIFRSFHKGDQTIFEKDVLESLALGNELAAFKHNGFWQPMDTLRDKTYLEELWKNSNAKWKVWE